LLCRDYVPPRNDIGEHNDVFSTSISARSVTTKQFILLKKEIASVLRTSQSLALVPNQVGDDPGDGCWLTSVYHTFVIARGHCCVDRKKGIVANLKFY